MRACSHPRSENAGRTKIREGNAMTVWRNIAAVLACAPLLLAAPANAQDAAQQASATSRTQRGDEQMLPVPYRLRCGAMPAAGCRGWEAALYRMVGRGGVWTTEEIKLMADYLGTDFGPNASRPAGQVEQVRLRSNDRAFATNSPIQGDRHARAGRQISVDRQISRRSFVGGLTKAGLTVTAAQSCSASVSSVSYAQTGPAPSSGRRRRRRARLHPATAGRRPPPSAVARSRARAAPPSPISSSPAA